MKDCKFKNSPYQELFEYMSNEHGLILLHGEMQEIVNIVERIDTTGYGFEAPNDDVFEDKEIDDHIEQEILAKKAGMRDDQILNGEHFDIEF